MLLSSKRHQNKLLQSIFVWSHVVEWPSLVAHDPLQTTLQQKNITSELFVLLCRQAPVTLRRLRHSAHAVSANGDPGNAKVCPGARLPGCHDWLAHQQVELGRRGAARVLEGWWKTLIARAARVTRARKRRVCTVEKHGVVVVDSSLGFRRWRM